MRLINLILTGIASAEAVAVVRCLNPTDETSIEVLDWDVVKTTAEHFHPSASLIREASCSGQSIVYQWRSRDDQSAPCEGLAYDWAFCTPLVGESTAGRAIYVTGNWSGSETPSDLRDELKFVELVGTTVSNVSDLRQLQERTAALAQFFSPPVREAVAAADPNVTLAPRRTEVTVMFCDLRGFSRQTEQAGDELFDLLQRVSEALGIMTRQILDFGGVVGDFHGDAAMGFWGWPLADPNRVEHACQAALAIQSAFELAARQPDHALSGFRVGMGLATGLAVAGKLGTVDQVKVTAFGPVVNLASRLEGLTRPLGTAILIDQRTAEHARHHLPLELGEVRYVARVQPYGLTNVEDVYELATVARGAEPVGDAVVISPLPAVRAFRAGDWATARRELERWREDDPIRRFYLDFMSRTRGIPPSDWDGIIRFRDKP